jgi:hypothetical protein
MIGLGPRTGGISDSEAKEHADWWGCDPVHPSAAAYRKMAEDISEGLSIVEAHYTNPVLAAMKPDSKWPRVDFSLQRDEWVSSCLAALPKQDSAPSACARGKTPAKATKLCEGEACSVAEAGQSEDSVGHGLGVEGGKVVQNSPPATVLLLHHL